MKRAFFWCAISMESLQEYGSRIFRTWVGRQEAASWGNGLNDFCLNAASERWPDG